MLASAPHCQCVTLADQLKLARGSLQALAHKVLHRPSAELINLKITQKEKVDGMLYCTWCLISAAQLNYIMSCNSASSNCAIIPSTRLPILTSIPYTLMTRL